MKKRSILLFLSLVLLGSSCMSLLYPTPKQMSIQKGMTQQEILELLKEPSFRRFDENGEEWEYREAIVGGFRVTIIGFTDGRVALLDMFQEDASMPPSATVVVTPNHSTSHPSGMQRPPQNAPPARPHRRAMPAAEFDSFFRELKEGISFDRMKKIDAALLTNGFTSAQCRNLLTLFTFSAEQVELLKILYPQVVDKQQFSTVVDRMTYGTDKREINDYIENYNRKK